jgi:hypothetical protein
MKLKLSNAAEWFKELRTAKNPLTFAIRSWVKLKEGGGPWAKGRHQVKGKAKSG